jgi:hypothetical protein
MGMNEGPLIVVLLAMDSWVPCQGQGVRGWDSSSVVEVLAKRFQKDGAILGAGSPRPHKRST